jgi:uncharacterized metal-binding protein YceD (DUF177 family)
MTDAQPANSLRLRVADLAARRETAFDLRPDAATLAALADEFGVDALRKLRFAGRLIPDGRRDWRLEARLGATVVQPCVVTLAPVTTRIDEPVTRRYLADPAPLLPEGDEVEMPEDDTAEALPAVIDIDAVMTEALALAIPLYPRADGAELGSLQAAPPGAAPLDDTRVTPFAALAALRKDDAPDSTD